MGAVFKKKQQFYKKAIYKAKKFGKKQGWRDVNKYHSGTGSCPREQPREDHDPDDAPEGGVSLCILFLSQESLPRETNCQLQWFLQEDSLQAPMQCSAPRASI